MNGVKGACGGLCTVSDGSASMTNLFCLRSCNRVSATKAVEARERWYYLESDLHGVVEVGISIASSGRGEVSGEGRRGGGDCQVL